MDKAPVQYLSPIRRNKDDLISQAALTLTESDPPYGAIENALRIILAKLQECRNWETVSLAALADDITARAERADSDNSSGVAASWVLRIRILDHLAQRTSIVGLLAHLPDSDGDEGQEPRERVPEPIKKHRRSREDDAR